VTEFLCADTASAAHFILVEPEVGDCNRQGLSSVALPNDPASSVVLAIGPEGGWREEELRTAMDCGYEPVSLGSRVLRAETATVAGLAILQSRLGELG
jgi:RsmE family RNA methyltransferase